MLFGVVFAVFVIIVESYCKEINDMIATWYWDYTFKSMENPDLLTRKYIELVSKYSWAAEFNTFINDTEKVNAFTKKMIIGIECCLVCFNFTKVCYTENWI